MATKKSFKGVQKHQEVRIQSRRDDVRTFRQKLADDCATVPGTLKVFGTLGIAAVIFSPIPFFGEVMLVLAGIVFFRHYRFKNRLWNLGLGVPRYLTKLTGSPVLDAGTGKEGKANIYYGRDLESGQEIWGESDDLKTHLLMIGTTGSGKTEAFMSQVFNASCVGSGVMMVDGKASGETYDSMYRIARFFGRDMDLFAIDYLTGGKDQAGPQSDKRSNTFNPLNFGSAAQRSEMLTSLLSAGTTGTGSDIWSERATAFIEALLPPLSYLADQGYLLLTPTLLSDYLILENLENLAWHGVFVDLNGQVVDLRNGSDAQKIEYGELQRRLQPLVVYLENLPGYGMCRPKNAVQPRAMSDEAWSDFMAGPAGEKQDLQGDAADSPDQARSKVHEQHGYITMQWVRSIGNLAFNYGHIYNTPSGEIDMSDVVLNRRFVAVLLPALERSPQNLEQLGKLTVMALKATIGAMLHGPAEGDRREVIEGKPSRSATSYIAILDEVGYYMVPGIAVIPAQARSLGVGVMFGTQDIPSLFKGNEKEGAAIIDVTTTKMFGRVASDEQSQTAQTVINLGGKVNVQVAAEMKYDKGVAGVGSRLRYDDDSKLMEVSRIAYDDLVQQRNGEFHLVQGRKEKADDEESGGATVLRMLSFYTGDMPKVSQLRRNPFVVVKPLSVSQVESVRLAAVAQRAITGRSAEALQVAKGQSGYAAINADLIGRFTEWWVAAKANGPVSEDDIQAWVTAESEKKRLEFQRRQAISAQSMIEDAVIDAAGKVGLDDEDFLVDLLGDQVHRWNIARETAADRNRERDALRKGETATMAGKSAGARRLLSVE